MDRLIGYRTQPSELHNDLSLLSRGQNDGRYVLKNELEADRLQATNFEVIADAGLNNASPSLKLRYTAGPGDDFLEFNRISDAEVAVRTPGYL